MLILKLIHKQASQTHDALANIETKASAFVLLCLTWQLQFQNKNYHEIF